MLLPFYQYISLAIGLHWSRICNVPVSCSIGETRERPFPGFTAVRAGILPCAAGVNRGIAKYVKAFTSRIEKFDSGSLVRRKPACESSFIIFGIPADYKESLGWNHSAFRSDRYARS